MGDIVPWWPGPGGSGLYKNITSRTDHNINDEEAGKVRQTLLEEAAQKRKDEAERVAKLNAADKARLDAIRAKVDDGDGLLDDEKPKPRLARGSPRIDQKGQTSLVSLGAPRDQLSLVRDMISDRTKARIAEDNEAHKLRLKGVGPTITDDKEDPGTRTERARLKFAAASRRQAQDASLKLANAAYHERIKSAAAVTDTKMYEDVGGSPSRSSSPVATRSTSPKPTRSPDAAKGKSTAKPSPPAAAAAPKPPVQEKKAPSPPPAAPPAPPPAPKVEEKKVEVEKMAAVKAEEVASS